MGKKVKVTKSEVTKKKISFVSAIMLVVGSSIGAGIFLKNGEVLRNVSGINPTGSVILALVAWILSIFGVICMGLSLAEIGSANTSSNLGIVSWVKTFCHKYLYKASKYFMAILYLPINFFIMPYYLVMTLQDALGWQTTWWVAMLIAFAITTWLFFMSGLSSRAGNIANKAILSVKFIPLAFCAIAGIILACCGQCNVGKTIGDVVYPTWLPASWAVNKQAPHLIGLFPVLGIIGSIPAIIFSFDGFYAAAGIQSEMAEPKKTPLCLVIGLVIVSSLDVLISISLLIGSRDGRVSGLNFFTGDNAKAHIVISLMELFIAFGILGIINGFAIYNPLYYEDLIKENELPFSDKLKPLLNRQRNHWVGLIYSGVLTLFFFFVLSLVGAFAYSDVGGYGWGSTSLYEIMSGKEIMVDGASAGYEVAKGTHLPGIYSMADLMANWTAIIAFLCIVFALVGCLKNRKTNRVKVTKVKGFVPCAIAATAVISLAILFIVGQTIGDFFLEARKWSQLGAGDPTNLGVIMTFVMLVFFVAVCCIPSSIEMHREKGIKTKTTIVHR